LPLPAAHYPAGVQLALLPFGEQALAHFMFLERPEGMDLDDAEGLAAAARAEPVMNAGDIVPRPQDFATVGHLYRSIEAGFAHLAEKYGENWLFVGPPRAQATPDYFRWPDLVTVTDLNSAQRAIDTVLEQGEGPRGDWRNAHFGQFVEILDEYQQMCSANPDFDPVRAVIAANVRPPEGDAAVPMITDPLTARVADLFNVGYEILLQVFYRYFAHTEETDAQLKVLADATISLMASVLQPLANVITTLPAGPGHEGKTAGPSFELFYEADYLLPHRESAWALLTERLEVAASFCVSVGSDCSTLVADRLTAITAALREIASTLAAHLPAERSGRGADGLDPATVGARLARATELIRQACHEPGSHDLAAELAALADLASAAQASKQTGTSPADLAWPVAKAATELRARAGRHGLTAPKLAEATAALQSLVCELGSAKQRTERRAQLWRLQGDLPAGIQTARNGPYLATNVRLLRDHLGQEIPTQPQLALCRCGGSATKPSCDGSCASNGFADAKDPKRVPDRLDTYPGVQLTVLDNRGTCQHSGLCTDRLPTVFRAGQEPFVAPSGARQDEIISAIRNCPSGALSIAIDGKGARGMTDWGGTREPAIEVTRDGPYRVTGGIELTDADGRPVPRNGGASLEHYAVCRCGHSLNKPFCSGMHWYVDFHDPVTDPGREPTIFEWAGGLPALTRMTRLFCEKYVPGDPLLAPLFANAPPSLPQLMATYLGEVFGGPAARDTDGYSRVLSELLGEGLNSDQRSRWVTLLPQAALESGLPADPEFRAALTSFIEWDIASPPDKPTPRWDWGPPGPPSIEAADGQEDADQQVALPEPGQPVSFAAHIKPLFRKKDRDSMSFALDLWSYEEVKAAAGDILERVSNGTMPCDGAWPKERVDVFSRWTTTQMQP
jgi:CDGSH-type Zn-finger protein/truncated hemoglobin YjbI/ferredoxin